MSVKMASSVLPAGRGLMYFALLLVTTTSCLDFQFESEYEDINGIHLEFLEHYAYGGKKLLFRGDTGYISRYDSLLVYDFTKADSIYLLDIHLSEYQIADFLLEDDCVFLILHVGLRIIDIITSPPQIVGSLVLQNPEIIKKSANYAYITAANNFMVIDVTEKANPILMSSYALNHSINHLEVDSNFAYVMAGNTIQILDIETPSAPSLVYYLSFSDTLPYPLAFSKKENYLYVSARYSTADSNVLITYDLSNDRTLHRVSQIACPPSLYFINCHGQYPIALSTPYLFLLNLEYPYRACLGDAVSPGGNYGVVNRNYIYTINQWSLNIFRIIEIE